MNYETINPATGERVASYEVLPDTQVEEALERAAGAFAEWRRTPLQRRSAMMLEAARDLEERADEYGRLMALEMGKPVSEGASEAKKCAWVCRYYAENASEFLSPRRAESDGSEAYVRRDPLGPILAIMPWNFPFWQVYRFAAPALMAGNVVLLKHAPNTPQCALAIEESLHKCGFAGGIIQSLFLTNEQAARVIADRRVRGVTLTGSTRAGRQVAETAGRSLKTMVMELGGSDAFIVLPDADVAEAARVGVLARCLNAGQSCIAAKRFILHADIFNEFRDRFVEGMRSRVMGDPAQPDVNLGPLARKDLRDQLASQVERSVKAGARPLLGGETPDRPGWFYPPTVLADIPDSAPAACEELFGPVASLISCDSEEQALEIANGTPYGLGASLWTADLEQARRLIPRIDSGAVFVNGLVKSDPRLPFGGVKDSGFGRELAAEGILEFVNQKTVWIR